MALCQQANSASSIESCFFSGVHHQLTRRINKFHELRQSVPFHFLDFDALCSRLGEFVREHGVEIWRAGGEHTLVSWDFHVTTDEDNITKLPVSEEGRRKEMLRWKPIMDEQRFLNIVRRMKIEMRNEVEHKNLRDKFH